MAAGATLSALGIGWADLSAPVAEDAGAGWAGDGDGELEDLHAGEGA